MDKYQFQYTKMSVSFLVILFCIVVCGVVIILGLCFHLPQVLIILLALISPIFPFRILKAKAVGVCNAKLENTFVEFEFENSIVKKVDFSSLKSFKGYYGKNGPIIYLTSPIENFKIFANSKFCDPKNFYEFSKALFKRLDNFRDTVAPSLVHKGSILAFNKNNSL